MIRTQSLVLSAVLLLSCVASATAQSYQPKTIQFKGDSEYSDTELDTAAGLKKGMTLTAAQMNDCTKLLMDSGVFQNVSFTFNGQDLIFQLIPATPLYPLLLENLPVITIGTDLDQRLHARFPLYHGKVPTDGGLLEGVRKELEDELAAKGIKATIAAAPYTDLKLSKVTAMSFAITDPNVKVGEIQLNGTSADLAGKARLVAAKIISSAYSADGSASQLETSLGNFYGEQGYLEAKVHATAQPAVVVDATGVHIPFTVSVDEGTQYKLSLVQLASDLVITQEAFDKQSDLHSGQVVSLEKLRREWAFIGRQYHNKGFMKANVLPTATFDHAQGTVSYLITVEPGPVYTMGTLQVENVSEDLRAAIVKVWPMQAGMPFNEGAILGMTATHGINPALERVFATVDLRYKVNLHEDVHTADVDLRLERKHP
jgi:outer membrane protein insertion porin family